METNIHTKHHNKDDSGRSTEVERYIEEGVNWVLSQITLSAEGLTPSVVDIGCDYGFGLHLFREKANALVIGIDPYASINPFDIPISKEWSKTGFAHADLVVFNHSLEHFDSPKEIMAKALNTFSPKFVYLGLPEATASWAIWEGHESIWTEQWMIEFMHRFGYVSKAVEKRCFRKDFVELWGIFQKEDSV